MRDWLRRALRERRGHGAGWVRACASEDRAQSTLEYAITTVALLSLIAGIAALWRAGEDGVLVGLVEDAASHALSGIGALDIALY